MGGEKTEKDLRLEVERGSPPHGRGKAVLGGFPPGDIGITPAWAGKSEQQATMDTVDMDHPRMGGEKRTAASGDAGDTGSPPHGRGKAQYAATSGGILGITPAWAGKRLI